MSGVFIVSEFHDDDDDDDDDAPYSIIDYWE